MKTNLSKFAHKNPWNMFFTCCLVFSWLAEAVKQLKYESNNAFSIGLMLCAFIIPFFYLLEDLIKWADENEGLYFFILIGYNSLIWYVVK
jgi:hypothetical protein